MISRVDGLWHLPVEKSRNPQQKTRTSASLDVTERTPISSPTGWVARRQEQACSPTEARFSHLIFRMRHTLACWRFVTSYRRGTHITVLLDILIAVVIVVIAAVLGLVVHPILWIIIIVAVLWLFFRRSRW
jgi:hypothetical protein